MALILYWLEPLFLTCSLWHDFKLKHRSQEQRVAPARAAHEWPGSGPQKLHRRRARPRDFPRALGMLLLMPSSYKRTGTHGFESTRLQTQMAVGASVGSKVDHWANQSHRRMNSEKGSSWNGAGMCCESLSWQEWLQVPTLHPNQNSEKRTCVLLSFVLEHELFSEDAIATHKTIILPLNSAVPGTTSLREVFLFFYCEKMPILYIASHK